MSTGPLLAEQLRDRRRALGLTQAELAERAGISERAVSDIERGLRQVVYRDTAQRLVRALELSGEAALRFEDAARGRRGAVPKYGVLPPVPRTPIFGRSSELAALTELLQDPGTRLVTITGPGGVGKTRLALELWSSILPGFPDGMAFIPLGDLREPAMVVPAIAGVLKVPDGSDPHSLTARLSGRQLLLILDTFEHLLGAVSDLATVVAGSAPAKVLVTSRVPLNIRAETLMPLLPLAQVDAVAMLVSCVDSLHAGTASRLEPAVSADICRRVEGLPLAIELAAARARLLSPGEIRSHLEHRLQLLVGGPVDLPERQRSMAATIAWSYDLLPSDDRRQLERLSVFAGGWTAEAGGQVCELPGGGLPTLGGLVDASLVLPEASDTEPTRYRMLDTIREYAAERLATRVGESGLTSLRRRHAQYFRALAEEAEPGLRAAGHQASVTRLSVEQDNLRTALGWAIAQNDVETALRMGGALWMFWRLTGAFSEGRAWLAQALAMDARDRQHLRAAALWGAGWLAYQQGDFQETAGRGAELRQWAQAAGNAAAARNGLTLLGQERLAAGDYDAASRHFDEALRLARSTGSSWLLATSCLNRSLAAQQMGDLDRAAALLTEAEAHYRDLGDDRFLARVWLQLTYLALENDDRVRARDLAVAGLASVSELGDRWGIAEQLGGVAAVLAADGDGSGAAFAAGAAQATWASIGARPHPVDRRSTDRWLVPALAATGDAGATAFREGAATELEEALARVLEKGR